MDQEISVESFATELAQADSPEQPEKGSGAATNAQDGGAETDTNDAQDADQPETDGEQTEQPEQPPEGSGEGDDDPVQTWTTASGEKLEVKLSELRDGYLRTQDYTRKAQDLSENVKRAQSDIQFQASAVQAMTSEIGEIQALQGQIAQFNGIDWAAAERQDPQASVQAQTRLLLLKQQLAEVQGRASGRMQQLKQAQEAQFAQAVSAAEQHLQTKFPELNRDEVGRVFAQAAKLGATQTELNFMRGMPWLLELAIHGTRHMELMSKKPEVQNRVRNLPPPKTAPRAATPTSKTDEAIKAINTKRSFNPAEFAKLLSTTL